MSPLQTLKQVVALPLDVAKWIFLFKRIRLKVVKIASTRPSSLLQVVLPSLAAFSEGINLSLASWLASLVELANQRCSLLTDSRETVGTNANCAHY